ncbi:MAG TPA: hypothetical protein VHM91_19240 [Verrucomicrobiales bacterium]|jgi:hypothetical protein|nr:hypothetical protein [Verrucomicrobiales bacterium]
MKLSHFALAGLFLLLGAGIYLTMKTEMDGQVEQLKAENERKFEQYEKTQKEQAALLAKSQAASEKALALAPTPEPPKAPPVNPKAVNPKAVKPKASSVIEDEPEIASVPKKVIKAVAPEVADAPPPSGLLPAPAAPVVDEEKILEKERDVINSTGINDDRTNLENSVIAGAQPSEEGAAEGDKLTKTQALVMAQPPIARVKETTKEMDSFVVLDRGSNSNLAKGDKFSVRRGTFILGKIVIGETVHPTECVADIVKLNDGASLKKGDEIIKWDR